MKVLEHIVEPFELSEIMWYNKNVGEVNSFTPGAERYRFTDEK